MVNLVRIKLVNFIGIWHGTNRELTEIEIDRTNSPNNIILILGENGSGKTSLMAEMTPLPLEHVGDRTKSRIIPDKVGIKELDYLVDGFILYKIKIIYDPKKTTKCFIKKCVDGKEIDLNPNGNVESYLEIIENELHMSKNYTNVGYLCGSGGAKDFVSMKPAERNNYISEWMPEISEFLDAYKKSAKIINKLKKEIDNYNKQIGNMSSINYELELNYVDTNIASITKNLKEVETNITQLLTYNSQFEKYVLSDRELNDKKSKLISTIRELNNKKDEIMEKWSKFNIPNTSDPIQFQKELDMIQRKENDLIQQIQSIEDKMSLLSSEISSSKAMLNTDERISRMDLNSIYNTIDSNNELLNTINKSIVEIENKYEMSEDQLKTDSSVISDTNTMLQILDDRFIQLNNLVPMETIIDMSQLEKSLSDKNERYQLVDNLKKTANEKLTFVNNEIYKYEHGNLDTEILMKRPKFCETHQCGIVDELLKYLNPKDNLTELYNESTTIQKQIFDYDSELTEIKESLENMKKGHQIYVEIEDFLMKNTDKIGKMPTVISDYFTKELYTVYVHINDIKGIINDITEFSSLCVKRDDISKSINDLENIKSLVFTNSKLNEKIKQSLQNYEELKSLKESCYNEYDQVHNLVISYKNAESLIVERENEISDINYRIKQTLIDKHNLLQIAKVNYVYNSNKNYIETKLNKKKLEYEKELTDLNKKRDEMTTFYISKRQIEKMRNELQEQFNRINILNKIWSPKVGYPSWKIESFLNELTVKTNEDLNNMWGENIKIEKFNIDENEFSIRINKNGETIPDASVCSQGETKTITTAISFSIIESNVDKGGYDVLRLDEVDGAFDETRRRGFMDVIQNRINEMGCDSCFIITHNGEFEDIPCDIILMKDAKIDEEKLKNKNILFRY